MIFAVFDPSPLTVCITAVSTFIFAVLLSVLSRLLIMSINTNFSIFQDGGRSPSLIFKSWNFCWTCSMGQYAYPCQISCRLVKPLLKYSDFFRFFRKAAAAILDCKNFRFVKVGTIKKSNCDTVPNFVKIAETAAEIWWFCYFLKWRPPPYWIFKITNF